MTDSSSPSAKPNRRVAFLIGNCSFPYAPDLHPLTGPQNDVRRLGEIFENPDIGGYEVHSFIDHRSNDILPALEERLSELSQQDFVLVYYSGHGRLDRSGRLCLASADTRSNAIVNTSIRVRSLTDLLYQSNVGNTLLLLDCCFSGAAGQDLRGTITDELSQHQTAAGHHVFTSSTDTEVSREEVDSSAGQKLGAFTATLIQGLLSGEADDNKDGAIGLQELRAYVQNSLRKQKPQYWGQKTSGDPLIALNHGRSDKTRIARVDDKLRTWVSENKLDPVVYAQMLTALHQPETEAEKRAKEILLRLHDTKSFTPEVVELTWRKFVGRPTGEPFQPPTPPPEPERPVAPPPEPPPGRPIHTGLRVGTGGRHGPTLNIRRQRLLRGAAVAASLIVIAVVLWPRSQGPSIGEASQIGMISVDTTARDSVRAPSDTQSSINRPDTTATRTVSPQAAGSAAGSVAAGDSAQKTPPGEAKKDSGGGTTPAGGKKGTVKPGPAPEKILANAVKKMENEDYAAAVPVFRRYLAQRPADHEARYYLAVSLSKIDSTSRAEREFRESLRLRPDYEPSLRELGVVLVHQQRTTEAMPFLEKARQLDPDKHRTYTHLAIGYVDQNQPSEAEWYFRKALELDDDDTEAKQHLGALLYRKAAQYARSDSTVKALTTAQEAQVLVEPNAQQRQVLAGAYAEYGFKLAQARNYQDAKLYYEKALLVEPYNALAYSGLLGILHDVEFDFVGAFRHAAEWMRQFPNDTSRLTEMIEAYVTAGTSAGEIFDTMRDVGLKPDSRVVVDALELVSLAASGEEALLQQRKSQLKSFVSGLAPNLDYHWRFTGTLHYVTGLDPRNRDWLARLLTAIQNNDQARILDALG